MALEDAANSYGFKETAELDAKCSFVITLDHAGKIEITSSKERSSSPMDSHKMQSEHANQLHAAMDEPGAGRSQGYLNYDMPNAAEQQQQKHDMYGSAAGNDAGSDMRSAAIEKFVKVLHNQRQQRTEMKPSFVVLDNAVKQRRLQESISIQTAMERNACHVQQQTLPFDICAHAGSQTDELQLQCAHKATTYCPYAWKGNEFKQHVSADLPCRLNHMRTMEMPEQAAQPIECAHMQSVKHSISQDYTATAARDSPHKSNKWHSSRPAVLEEPLLTPVSNQAATRISQINYPPLKQEQYAPQLQDRQPLMQPQCQACKAYQQLLPQLSLQVLHQPMPQVQGVPNLLPQISLQALHQPMPQAQAMSNVPPSQVSVTQQQSQVFLAPSQLWQPQANASCQAGLPQRDALQPGNMPRVTISLVPLQLSQPAAGSANLACPCVRPNVTSQHFLPPPQQPKQQPLQNNSYPCNVQFHSQPAQAAAMHGQCSQHIMQLPPSCHLNMHNRQHTGSYAASATMPMQTQCVCHQVSALNMACGMPHYSACCMHQHRHAHARCVPCYNAAQQQWHNSGSSPQYNCTTATPADPKCHATDVDASKVRPAGTFSAAAQPSCRSGRPRKCAFHRPATLLHRKRKVEVPPNQSEQRNEINKQQPCVEQAAAAKQDRFLGGAVAQTTGIILRKTLTVSSINGYCCYMSRFRRSRVIFRPAAAKMGQHGYS